MKRTIHFEDVNFTQHDEPIETSKSSSAALVEPPDASGGPAHSGLVIGELVALKDDGRTPLVMFPRQRGSAAVAARSLVPLQARHIGGEVALMFEYADVSSPIVVGVLCVQEQRPMDAAPGHVEVDVDGERMIVTATQRLTLRCGHASITLTREGKVLIEGTFVSTRSTGLNRIVGGAVQIN